MLLINNREMQRKFFMHPPIAVGAKHYVSKLSIRQSVRCPFVREHWTPITRDAICPDTASCDKTSASLATCQICLILLLVLHVSVMYLFVFGEQSTTTTTTTTTTR